MGSSRGLGPKKTEDDYVYPSGEADPANRGKTLLEDYAGIALYGLLSGRYANGTQLKNDPDAAYSELARHAKKIAKAMIKELAKD